MAAVVRARAAAVLRNRFMLAILQRFYEEWLNYNSAGEKSSVTGFNRRLFAIKGIFRPLRHIAPTKLPDLAQVGLGIPGRPEGRTDNQTPVGIVQRPQHDRHARTPCDVVEAHAPALHLAPGTFRRQHEDELLMLAEIADRLVDHVVRTVALDG